MKNLLNRIYGHWTEEEQVYVKTMLKLSIGLFLFGMLLRIAVYIKETNEPSHIISFADEYEVVETTEPSYGCDDIIVKVDGRNLKEDEIVIFK